MIAALIASALAHDTHEWTAFRFCIAPDLTMLEGAEIGGTSPSCTLDLAGPGFAERGAAWFDAAYTITPVTRIRVAVEHTLTGNHGLALGLQGQGITAIGGSDADLATDGIPGVFVLWRPATDTVEVRDATGAVLATAPSSVALDGARVWSFVEWSRPSGAIEVRVSSTETPPPTPLLTAYTDVGVQAGGPIYAGFTGANAGLSTAQVVHGWSFEIGRDDDDDGIYDDEDPCPFDPIGFDDDDGDGVCNTFDQCLGDDALGDPDGDGVCGVPAVPTGDTGTTATTGHTGVPGETGLSDTGSVHTGGADTSGDDTATGDTADDPDGLTGDTAPGATDTGDPPLDTAIDDTSVPQDTDPPTDTDETPTDTDDPEPDRRCGCAATGSVTGWVLAIGVGMARRRRKGTHG